MKFVCIWAYLKPVIQLLHYALQNVLQIPQLLLLRPVFFLLISVTGTHVISCEYYNKLNVTD
jgi:hypothetical protein